jgi:hypothetical protein
MMTTPPPDRESQVIVRALAPDAITPDLTLRMRALADDLDRVAQGEAPTAADLAQAPLLVDWRFMLTWAGVGLAGFVAGHPLRGSRHIATSPLWVLDPELRWGRTLSRFYRLGVPASGAIPGGDVSEGGDAQP